MIRRWQFLALLATGLLATAGSPRAAAGRDGPPAPPAHAWGPAERDELLGYARGTWHSFEAMTGPDGLTADRLERDDRGAWHPSKQTSPSDIGAYLWSTLAARALGLIDDAAADGRIGATLATLGRLERHRGLFYNQYDVATGARLGVGAGQGRPFLSTVDNGWLAAGLTMVRNARPALRDRAEALLDPIDFGFFYAPFDPADPVRSPGQLHGGYFGDDRTFTAPYGMLNTEPRIASYLALARRQVPPEHYYRLFRTLPLDRGPQKQAPRGRMAMYGGVPVYEGHYEARGVRFVPSWGGSMFEALMVPLFVPEEAWAPRSWGVNHPNYVRVQVAQGLEVMRYGFWGFSPSCTPEGGYQTYGVADLGSEVGGYLSYEEPSPKPQGKGTPSAGRRGVVTPHASFLALRYAPGAALANLRALARAFPILGPEGFYDSVDVATGQVSRNVLSLDQGMILAAIANALADDAIRHAFSDGAIEAAVRPLIAPEEFSLAPDRQP